MDQFYAIVTGEENAFHEMCMVLPEIIDLVVTEDEEVKVPQDTVSEELRKLSELYEGQSEEFAMAMAVYLLAFHSYSGFCKPLQVLDAKSTEAMLNRLYKYARQFE